jgi:type II secretory pathway predicted ATPase ExeA
VSAEAIEPLNPQPSFIATAPARVLLATLEKGIGARAPFVLLTGEKGTGKSMLAAEALYRWGDRVSPAEMPAPAPEPGALAATLLELFGGTVKSGANAFAVMDRLLNVLANVTAGGRVAVLVGEDAHTLTPAHVLELQRIAAAAANRQCPLELLLVGLPALEAMFDAPELAAVASRVSVRAHLAPLSQNETREFLQMRPNSAGGPSLGLFSRKACRDVYHASLGVIATIEVLAAEAARRAQRAGSSTVSPEHVRAAANSLRAGRAEDAAHTLPPRQARSTPAVITPLPRPAAAPGTRADAPAAAPAAASAAAPAAGRSSGATPAAAASDFPGSSDERVKEWVARFGGSGVRIGARTAQRTYDEPQSFEVASVVVTKRGKQIADATVPVEPSEPAAAEAERETPIEEAAQPVRDAAPAKPRKLIILDESSESVDWSAARRVAPPAAERRPGFRPPARTLLTTLAVALLALALSQHERIGQLMKTVANHAPRTSVAPAPAPAPAPTPAAVAPAVPVVPQATGAMQYAISVGSFATRDMALPEADYMGRLVPLRVKVAPAGPGAHGYRLLLGKFDTEDAAQVSMRKLQGRGLIPDAKTVELPSSMNGTPAKPAKHASRHHHGRHR